MTKEITSQAKVPALNPSLLDLQIARIKMLDRFLDAILHTSVILSPKEISHYLWPSVPVTFKDAQIYVGGLPWHQYWHSYTGISSDDWISWSFLYSGVVDASLSRASLAYSAVMEMKEKTIQAENSTV